MLHCLVVTSVIGLAAIIQIFRKLFGKYLQIISFEHRYNRHAFNFLFNYPNYFLFAQITFTCSHYTFAPIKVNSSM